MRPNSTFAAVVGLFAGAGAFVGSASQAEATETELASAIAVTVSQCFKKILASPVVKWVFFLSAVESRPCSRIREQLIFLGL
jgi:hypothetical protein